MQIQFFKLFKNCSINILKKSSLRFLEPKIIFLVPQNVTVGSPGPHGSTNEWRHKTSMRFCCTVNLFDFKSPITQQRIISNRIVYFVSDFHECIVRLLSTSILKNNKKKTVEHVIFCSGHLMSTYICWTRLRFEATMLQPRKVDVFIISFPVSTFLIFHINM